MTKVLCLCDSNEPYQVMKNMKALEKYGAEVVFIEDEQLSGNIEDITNRMHLLETEGLNSSPTSKNLLDNIEDADILVVHVASVNKEIIAKAKKLKLVACLRGGLENIDKKDLKERNITLIHASWRSANAVADFAIGMMIAENKNIARGHNLLFSGKWDKDFVNNNYIRDMNKCTVGLLGFGNIGQRVAKRLKGFGSEIIVHDPFLEDDEINKIGVKSVSKEESFKNSDFISLHLRQSPKTMNFVNEKEISLMKPQAYLINTARSGILNTTALIRALKKKKIGGAALDVYDQEPLPQNSPLLQLNNVTLTPHIAGFSSDTVLNSVEICLDDLKRYFEGKQMKNVVRG